MTCSSIPWIITWMVVIAIVVVFVFVFPVQEIHFPRTTIDYATDVKGHSIQNVVSTFSTSVVFQVRGTPGTYPISGFECSLDGLTFSTCNPNLGKPAAVGHSQLNSRLVSYNNLAAGYHHFEVRAVDIQGNKDPNPATFDFFVERHVKA